MPSPLTHYYSVPFAPPKERGPHVGKFQKRKRGARASDSDNDDDSDGEPESPALSGSPTAPANSTTLSELDFEDARSYERAGQPYEKELPGFPFPHAAIGGSRHLPSVDIDEELANLQPPLVNLGLSLSKDEGLKERHISLLTTLMHRCLQDGDYIRAQRAFALLLRTEVNGKTLDVREDSLWSIGAEILLRQGMQVQNAKYITPEAFGQTKRYYQRLILDFPYRTTHPAQVSALHFYPALYALWIAYAQDQHKAMLEAIGHIDSGEVESDSSQNSKDHAALIEVRTTTLSRAKDIAGSMDATLQIFPFSDNPDLQKLRKDVALWVGDLEVDLKSIERSRNESLMSVDGDTDVGTE